MTPPEWLIRAFLRLYQTLRAPTRLTVIHRTAAGARYPLSLFPICGKGCREVGFHLQPWNSLPGPTKAEGDQTVESISLHRRVGCEPDFPDHGCSIPAPIAPRVDRDRLAQPFSGRSPISAIEDAGEPRAFCRTEFVGSAALAIQFRQKRSDGEVADRTRFLTPRSPAGRRWLLGTPKNGRPRSARAASLPAAAAGKPIWS